MATVVARRSSTSQHCRRDQMHEKKLLKRVKGKEIFVAQALGSGLKRSTVVPLANFVFVGAAT